MNINEIMSIDIENLKEKQFEALKNHVLNKLITITNLIKNNEFDKVHQFLTHSPAGDGYGCNNYYIDFGYDNESLDIDEIILKLKYLIKD